MERQSRYAQIIEAVFLAKYHAGTEEVPFDRADLAAAAEQKGLAVPKNLGDVVYSFRYRADFPQSVAACAPPGKEWIIRPRGAAQYAFVAVPASLIVPNLMMADTKVPDATPGIIEKYALDDEQALLAKLRYNRLVDVFTGVTCYSLQSHLRTHVKELGQVETDEIYVGVDKRGAHYVFPVQAKGGRDRLSVVQIEQDFALCERKFPRLICLPIAAQFLGPDLIALFAFQRQNDLPAILAEKHYRLVAPEQVTEVDLLSYRAGPVDW